MRGSSCAHTFTAHPRNSPERPAWSPRESAQGTTHRATSPNRRRKPGEYHSRRRHRAQARYHSV
jgi:hypothetical protein